RIDHMEPAGEVVQDVRETVGLDAAREPARKLHRHRPRPLGELLNTRDLTGPECAVLPWTENLHDAPSLLTSTIHSSGLGVREPLPRTPRTRIGSPSPQTPPGAGAPRGQPRRAHTPRCAVHRARCTQTRGE